MVGGLTSTREVSNVMSMVVGCVIFLNLSIGKLEEKELELLCCRSCRAGWVPDTIYIVVVP